MASSFKELIKNFNRKGLNASNKSGSRQAFYGNSLFRELAYSDMPATDNASELMPIRNFQKSENYLYGRVDTDFDAVTPNKGSLIPIADSNSHAISYAAIAFDSMKEEIRRDVAGGKIPSDIPFISNLTAVRGFEDINTSYNAWAKNYLKGSFPAYLNMVNKKDQIVDFDSFIKIFKEHLMALADELGAVNFSSFCLIYQSNIRNSGLCIEIAGLDFSNTADKIRFSENPFFPYYVAMAEKHGFFVDYNAPWRLVFNLASHVITARPWWSGLFSFFNNAFSKSYQQDLTILKNIAFTTYRDFSNRFPSFMSSKLNTSGCVVRKKITRQKYTKEEFDKNYPDRYWISLYVDLKNQEKNLNFNDNEIDKIKKKSLNYKKYVDTRSSLGYINKVFQDIPSVEGSYYYLYNQFSNRDQDPLPFGDFDEYIREIVKSYKQI
tara:strand:- start:9012 stop:10319 length:1308 start_codon:yes stop_codon:yes gene_type:complete